MTAYYNENDPKAAEWLRNLILMGEIAEGIVDERSIEDVTPSDLSGFTQCHFFAGIGGWSYALRLAGWPDNERVWTGSCPCQPFSAAGKGAGFADERHLWPAWFWLIAQCRPVCIFGEQVANATAWLDLVFRDLEAEDYAGWAMVLGAHSVGAPHIRQRLYWVALEHATGDGRQQWRPEPGGRIVTQRCGNGSVADAAGRNTSAERQQRSGQHGLQPQSDCCYSDGGVADANSERQQERREPNSESQQQHTRAATPTFWDNASRFGPDAKGLYRPIEPGLVPLVDGVPGRVGLLRGYGNAIVPQVAAAFIKAYLG